MEALYARFSCCDNKRTATSEDASDEDQEYLEEEVWDVMDDPKDDILDSSSSPNSSAWISAPRPIMRATSLDSNHHHHYHHQGGFNITRSAPVNTPDWLFKLRNDGDVCEDDYMVPPHVFLMRRYTARTRIVLSMYEGVGRTLKGRDLTTLRNAVLCKTGFIE